MHFPPAPFPVLLAILPIATLLLSLSILRRPAWQAASAALAVGALEAAWAGMPLRGIATAVRQGASTGLFPIGLVIVAALFAHAVTVESGAIADIKRGFSSLSSDHRHLALLVVWGFGNFMEGMAGFGTAVAIPCAILAGVGFDPLRAVLCCLVANTTPTAFGSVGVPTYVLAGEAGVPVPRLAAAIALLQLAVTALGPFLILVIADGRRGLRRMWRLALVADVAFLVPWLGVALAFGHELPDIAGAIGVMAALALAGDRSSLDVRRLARAWLPFGLVVALLAISALLPARWKPSPGLLVLAGAAAGGLGQGLRPRRLAAVFLATCRKYLLAVFTICAVLALAKILGAAGLTAALADFLVGAAGRFYAAVASVVGALGGFVTGSGTSSNVLFGALQASAGTNDFERLLFAAANVMGAGIGKMVCPQSVVLGAAAAGLAGRESEIMKRALPYFAAVLAVACAVTFLAAAVLQ